ncbi:synapse-associated protein 1 [Corythoichthys intestinalis]|uniref:synapse-associated protein 1 n=1 Tax=Corythoichthys intestinalis TaxID=161448 RepID=UPI0025A5C8B6|nr:synapse-associated protein 1 [Corythoichthys intestinalis]XP_061796523.1 synapse-associated protein 1-like [Nerophis lumbriciformis]
MLRGLGSWLGLENPTDANTSNDTEEEDKQKLEEKVVEAQNEVNKQQVDADGHHEEERGDVETNQELNKGLGDFIFSFASNATKKLSESVVVTAQSIKRSVEEGKIDGIIDKTFLGDFQKEQEKFVQEKKSKRSEAAVPPWVGYNEEETIQQQILALSADKRNFLRDPPAGVQFHFDMEQMFPLAAVMLEEDQLLNRMRFDLVPKHVKEEVFWRNYFYRVSLVKQSAQLTALAAQQQQQQQKVAGDGQDTVSSSDIILTDNVRPKTPPVSISDNQTPAPDEDFSISTSPGVSEFVSDAFESAAIDSEDLQKGMEQLVLDKKDSLPSVDEDQSDWEKELQQELQDYEVVAESDNRDEQWDQEIEEMLQATDP